MRPHPPEDLHGRPPPTWWTVSYLLPTPLGGCARIERCLRVTSSAKPPGSETFRTWAFRSSDEQNRTGLHVASHQGTWDPVAANLKRSDCLDNLNPLVWAGLVSGTANLPHCRYGLPEHSASLLPIGFRFTIQSRAVQGPPPSAGSKVFGLHAIVVPRQRRVTHHLLPEPLLKWYLDESASRTVRWDSSKRDPSRSFQTGPDTFTNAHRLRHWIDGDNYRQYGSPWSLVHKTDLELQSLDFGSAKLCKENPLVATQRYLSKRLPIHISLPTCRGYLLAHSHSAESVLGIHDLRIASMDAAGEKEEDHGCESLHIELISRHRGRLKDIWTITLSSKELIWRRLACRVHSRPSAGMGHPRAVLHRPHERQTATVLARAC